MKHKKSKLLLFRNVKVTFLEKKVWWYSVTPSGVIWSHPRRVMSNSGAQTFTFISIVCCRWLAHASHTTGLFYQHCGALSQNLRSVLINEAFVRWVQWGPSWHIAAPWRHVACVLSFQTHLRDPTPPHLISPYPVHLHIFPHSQITQIMDCVVTAQLSLMIQDSW